MDPLWYVYVLSSARLDRTYVGIALDVARRIAQHNGESRGGARSTRAGRPWCLAALYGPYSNRSEAQRIERRVKKLRGQERLTLLALGNANGAPAAAVNGQAARRRK